jgi:hypothetical protein
MMVTRALSMAALAFGIVVAPLDEAQQREGPTWN